MYGNLTWGQLLNEISRLALRQRDIEFSDDILESNTLKKHFATIDEVLAAEKRLAIVLPDDYKQFLLASNGFECFTYTGVTLSSIDDIDFLINVDEELVDIWTGNMDDIEPTFDDKFSNSIVIGGVNEEQQLLLIPLENDNWECWHFSSWRPGEVRYQSFRFYMEDQLQSLEGNFKV